MITKKLRAYIELRADQPQAESIVRERLVHILAAEVADVLIRNHLDRGRRANCFEASMEITFEEQPR